MPRFDVFLELLMGNAIHRPRAARRNENAVADAVAAGVVIATERSYSKSGILRCISLGLGKQKLSTTSLSVSELQFSDNPDPDGNQVGAIPYLFIALDCCEHFDRFLFH